MKSGERHHQRSFMNIARASIQAKALILMLALSLTPVIVISILDIQQTRKALTGAAESRLRSLAGQTADKLDTFLISTVDSLRAEAQINDLVRYLELADSPLRADSTEENNARNMLNRLTRKSPVYLLSYGLVDLRGNVLLDTDRSHEGRNESGEKYFTEALSSGHSYISDIKYRDDGNRIIRFANPIRNEDNVIIGVIRMEYNAIILQQVALQSRQAVGENTNVILLDEYDIQLTNSAEPGQIQKSLGPLDADIFGMAVAEKRLLPLDPAQQTGNKMEFSQLLKQNPDTSFFITDVYPDSEGRDAAAIANTTILAWRVVYTQPEAVFLREAENQTRTNGFFIGFIAIIMITAAIATAQNITRPISELTAISQKLAQGDLSARTRMEREDEIGILGQTMNNMAGTIQSAVAELEAKNAELERFTYTVSHDLKSPLITIRGFLGYIEDEAIKGDIPRLKKDLQRIADATNKMQALLSDLLELSRIGRMINPAESISFAAIVEQAIEFTTGQINESSAEIIVQENLPYVFADRTRMVEVLQNLIDNAIKFSRESGRPVIHIGVHGHDENGNPVFYIKDNGAGIDPQYHDNIFGLFNKLSASSHGTGVGLTLVKRIIELHGGRIWVESEGEGAGTTFYFTISMKADESS